ncbi:MAG: class I SAM-dependent methyltransferase [Micropruina sp.]|uniref:SAM-dependent methyltransferase n=1 Tax=Micropruina sp. TaxID=2737536 RepID=UPI0039E4BD92
MSNPMPSAPEFWDGFYADHTHAERGPVNRNLIAEVDGLEPGGALDLGCGEGADVLWLAERGWTVLGVDASATALDRARAHAERLGLAGRVTFAQHDLATSFPAGEFDLVSAQFLHSPVAAPGERERILNRAAAAVAPGGHLLVVSHWGVPPWHQGMPPVDHPVNLTLQSPEQNRAALQLADGRWQTVRDELDVVELTGPDGQPGTREDHVLHVRRTGR